MKLSRRQALAVIGATGAGVLCGPASAQQAAATTSVAKGKPNFEQRTLPDAGHAMRGAEPEAYRITLEWIRTHAAA